MGMRDHFKANRGGDFTSLPNGIYTCELTEARERERSWNGELEASLVFQIVEGNYADRLIFCDAPMRESMAWWVDMVWKGLGQQGFAWDGIAEGADDSEIWDRLMDMARQSIGRRVAIKLKQRSYTTRDGEKKTSEDVKAMKPATAPAAPAYSGGGGLPAPDPALAAQYAAAVPPQPMAYGQSPQPAPRYGQPQQPPQQQGAGRMTYTHAGAPPYGQPAQAPAQAQSYQQMAAQDPNKLPF